MDSQPDSRHCTWIACDHLNQSSWLDTVVLLVHCWVFQISGTQGTPLYPVSCRTLQFFAISAADVDHVTRTPAVAVVIHQHSGGSIVLFYLFCIVTGGVRGPSLGVCSLRGARTSRSAAYYARGGGYPSRRHLVGLLRNPSLLYFCFSAAFLCLTPMAPEPAASRYNGVTCKTTASIGLQVICVQACGFPASLPPQQARRALI